MAGLTQSHAGRIFLAAIVVFLFAFPSTGIVLAHGVLVRSDPADGSILQTSPDEIRLWFNEPISGDFSSVVLYDRNGQPLQVESLRADPNESGLLVVNLPELAMGTYSALWKVLSESDGHYSQGLLVFSIGAVDKNGGQTPRPAEAPPPPLPEVFLRWLNYATLAGMVGSLAIGLLVLSPQIKRELVDGTEESWLNLALHRVLYLGSICAKAAVPVALGMLAWQTYSLAGAISSDTSYLELGGQVLLETRWGLLWLARILPLVFLGVIFTVLQRKENSSKIFSRPEKPAVGWIWLLAVLLICALALVQALTSHAAGLRTNNGLAVLMDALHILAVGAWVGGTLTLAYGSFPVWRRGSVFQKNLLRTTWGSFSPVAALSVGVLISTGLYNTGRQVASADALLTTFYGHILLAKIGVMLVMCLIGLLNASLLHPKLLKTFAIIFRWSLTWSSSRLRRLPVQVLMEGSLGLLVFLFVGLITASPPPLQAQFTIPEDVPSALSQNVDDLVVTLSTKPNRPGENVFTVLTRSTRRPPLAEVSRVILRFTNLDIEMGKKSVIGEAIGPDRYLIGGNYLSVPGNWQIEVVVRRLGMEDSVATFHWVVPLGSGSPTLVSRARLEPYLTLTAAILMCLVLIIAAVTRTFRRNRSEHMAEPKVGQIASENNLVNQEVN